MLFSTRKLDENFYVQVTYGLPNNFHATDNYKKIVVTGKYHDIEQTDGTPIVYIADWLLEN